MKELVWVARDGTLESLDSNWIRGFHNVAISPDHRRLATTIRDGNGLQIWIRELASGRVYPLTTEGQRHDRPSWRPDSRVVTFRHDRGGGTYDLYEIDAAGGDSARLLLSRDASFMESTWSPDGRWLIFGERGERVDILGVQPEMEDSATLFVRTAAIGIQVSHDGHWLALKNHQRSLLFEDVPPRRSLAQ